ncbi:hypothetical protein [Moritella sp. F3]|uniref:hypothetical protein n=1 Tax=Moritella sp. F3 TaxID=2718882 RepID=UPI0018E1A1E3|nr:hypothetical protein [Moritella sp. F3]GIC77651.1 hypothetical protein FMO001_23780 [Moritella sp. F1]GIC82064.1 hypothetical protein FMO003_23450 [Moritella sp. F3]
MSEVLATVTFSDGQLKYTKFSTAFKCCDGELFETGEAALNKVSIPGSKSEIHTNLKFVNISVSGFDSWIGIATENNLLVSKTPFGIESINQQFEGVVVEHLMHLNKTGPSGQVQCGVQMPTKPLKKYIFDESLSCLAQFKGHVFSKKNPFELGQKKKLCIDCLTSIDVTNVANN